MPRNERQQRLPSPPVVSTRCSKLISCLSFRRGLPPRSQPPRLAPPAHRCESPARRSTHAPSSHGAGDDEGFARRVYWERVHQLELELLQLSRWLEAEKSLIDSLKEASRQRWAVEMKKLIRLRGGGYIRGITQPRRPWERLFLQVSEPGIAEFGSSFWGVITKMASVGAQSLEEFLRQSIPIATITGSDVEESKEDDVPPPGSESGFMEAIMSDAVEKLALEGLRIQMDRNPRKTSSVNATAETTWRRRREHEEPVIVVVVLMQVRDGMEDYREVGGRMIGLVEASSTGCVGFKGFNIEGLHVAGMGFSGSGDRSFMWSGSLKGCDGCCCRCVRNEDVAFTC